MRRWEGALSTSTQDQRITLLISCPDRPGIVAAVSQFIFQYQGNICESDQHSTDLHHGTFFMRISFTEDSFSLSREALVQAFTPIAEAFGMDWSVHYSRQQRRAALLVSKYDHCLVDLLWRWKSGELNMEIPCIVSNHRDLEPIARMYDIPYLYFPVRREQRREDEQRMLEWLSGKVDFLILARYMQILEPFFVNAYPRQIINIHHSFLPAFVGARPYVQAFERGVKLIGATAHYVTESLDEGPIIAQDVIHCNHRDQLEDLMRKGKEVERRVLAEAVRLHTEDRVLVHGNKTVVFH
ncbi:MAG TPA: formyltetrahydrofolate deformylase [Ktedonobacteraceae bacterium]|nr:formyltetrahydrofolate deformylase [Ktedonobacteraceae bacterium]